MEDRRPSQVVRDRVREVRTLKGWKQEDLSARLKGLGVGIDRATVGKIENGERKRLTLDDALGLAAALDVAPVHLIVPVKSDENVQLGDSNLVVAADPMRRWFRGDDPLPIDGVDEWFYKTQVSDQEKRGRSPGLVILHSQVDRLMDATDRGDMEEARDLLAHIEMLAQDVKRYIDRKVEE